MSGDIPTAREKQVREDVHYFCRWCTVEDRLAIMHDARRPDGQGPYSFTFEPRTLYDAEAGEWWRAERGGYAGMARGRAARRALDIPEDQPGARMARGALEAYTGGRRPLRVDAPVGTHVVRCRCGGRNRVTNPG